MKRYSFSIVDIKILICNFKLLQLTNQEFPQYFSLPKIIILEKYRLKIDQESPLLPRPRIKNSRCLQLFLDENNKPLDPPDFRFFICSAFHPPTPLFRSPTNHLIWPGTSPGIIARTRAYDGVRVSGCVCSAMMKERAGRQPSWLTSAHAEHATAKRRLPRCDSRLTFLLLPLIPSARPSPLLFSRFFRVPPSPRCPARYTHASRSARTRAIPYACIRVHVRVRYIRV